MLSKKKVDRITDLLLLGNFTLAFIAKKTGTSVTAVRKIRDMFPLFFPIRKYVIRRKKHNSS